jgi:hypothetical protein|tara:strand:- start:388 stop:555 length:168 start_codon:yes stop_codon:yes gene_type:complete
MALAAVVVFLVGADFWESSITDSYRIIGTVLMILGITTFAWLAVEIFSLVTGEHD